MEVLVVDVVMEMVVLVVVMEMVVMVAASPPFTGPDLMKTYSSILKVLVLP